jgi:hypothetical protein
VLFAAAAAILAVIEAMDYFRGKAVKKAAEDSNKLLEDFNKEEDPVEKQAIAKKALAMSKRMVQLQFDDIDTVMGPLKTIFQKSEAILKQNTAAKEALQQAGQNRGQGDSSAEQKTNIGDAVQSRKTEAFTAFGAVETAAQLETALEEQLVEAANFANKIINDKDRERFESGVIEALTAAVKERTTDGQFKPGKKPRTQKIFNDVAAKGLIPFALGDTPKDGNDKTPAATVTKLPSNTTEMLKKATAAFNEANNKRMQQNQAQIPGNFNTPIPAIIDASRKSEVYNTYEKKYSTVLTRNVELNRGMAY